MADFQDAVAGGDARQRNEADHGRHRQRQATKPHGDHAADQRQRDVRHDDQRECRGAVARVKHQVNQRQRHEGQQHDQLRGLLLRLELTLDADEIATGQPGARDRAAHIADDL
ncbi:hypothetical protein D3C72_1725970 [compost metagenome]